MIRYALKRLSIFAISLLSASVLVFIVCSLLPGDVAQVILGQNADPASVSALRERLGLDRPPVVRYFDWLGGMLQGDFGRSQLTNQYVSNLIAPRLGVTASIVALSMGLAIVLAVPFGLHAALRRRRLDGFASSAMSQLGLAIPAFWAGILLVWVFAVWLRWLPAGGYVRLTESPGQWASHLVLPVIALAIVQASVLARYVRSAIIEVLHEDYYRTARAVGWGQLPALARHGLRNAALSVVTVVGLQLATLLVGAIVIESVFALPGLGALLLSAVSQRDLMIVQGVVMLLVFAVLVINALVDLSYLVIDPRLRAGVAPPGARR